MCPRSGFRSNGVSARLEGSQKRAPASGGGCWGREVSDHAKHIVETKSGHFEPDKFEDHYEAALQDLLEKKKNGMPIAKAAAPSKGNVINLMEALKASIKTTGKKEPTSSAKTGKPAKKAAKPKRKTG